MRKAVFCFLFTLSCLFIYAGDIANFVNLGFSQDGTKFAFGEHGLIDETYQAYANIYCIDVIDNSFLPSGYFKTSPTKETGGKESKNIFLSLLDRANYSLDKWNIKQKNEGRAIYVSTNSTVNENTLMFRDFETEDEYVVVIHKDKKSDMEAAFYITVEIIRPNGSKITKEIGQKGKFRTGIRDYSIKKIIIDNTNTSLIFVIEKHLYTKSGISIRYMAEAVKL
ncbi:DUF2259 domain-containing protein [Treponema pedis]|uniref:DUF2259 domain-containing protein n=1 Tax=Treponema pedis TaxID=409322 RepID=UPI00041FFE2A|nr:DUF2259 domain-containing protein [Treponema pedis]